MIIYLEKKLKKIDPKYEYYVSDIPEKFASIAEEFLKKEIDDIKSVKI